MCAHKIYILILDFHGVEVPVECSRQCLVLVRFPIEASHEMENINKISYKMFITETIMNLGHMETEFEIPVGIQVMMDIIPKDLVVNVVVSTVKCGLNY